MQTIETNITGNSLNQPGEPVEITANVTNDGTTDDSIQLTLIRDRDGKQLATSNVSVDSRTTRTVSFNVTTNETEAFFIQGPASNRSVTIDVDIDISETRLQ